jgi:predicted transcriptional regulator
VRNDLAARVFGVVSGDLVDLARELATELGEAVQSVAARLQPLISAGLVSKHWAAPPAPARAYMITEDGRDHLALAEEPRKIVKHAAERLHR